MIIDSNRYRILVSFCLALAKSLARQVRILDLRGVLVLIHPESGIQHRSANPSSVVLGRVVRGYLDHQPFEGLRAVSLSNGSSV